MIDKLVNQSFIWVRKRTLKSITFEKYILRVRLAPEGIGLHLGWQHASKVHVDCARNQCRGCMQLISRIRL